MGSAVQSAGEKWIGGEEVKELDTAGAEIWR